MQKHLKDELHNVISGKSQVGFGAAIQTITGYLNEGQKASSNAESAKQIRQQETKKLEVYNSKNNLWINDIDFSQFVSQGAEQRVYLKDAVHVIKLNDAIYYECWMDYLYSLLLHNFFFEDTAYELAGFTKENGTLYAVVQQPYVSMTQNTEALSGKTIPCLKWIC
jgi:hypothetical protein